MMLGESRGRAHRDVGRLQSAADALRDPCMSSLHPLQASGEAEVLGQRCALIHETAQLLVNVALLPGPSFAHKVDPPDIGFEVVCIDEPIVRTDPQAPEPFQRRFELQANFGRTNNNLGCPNGFLLRPPGNPLEILLEASSSEPDLSHVLLALVESQ